MSTHLALLHSVVILYKLLTYNNAKSSNAKVSFLSARAKLNNSLHLNASINNSLLYCSIGNTYTQQRQKCKKWYIEMDLVRVHQCYSAIVFFVFDSAIRAMNLKGPSIIQGEQGLDDFVNSVSNISSIVSQSFCSCLGYNP